MGVVAEGTTVFRKLKLSNPNAVKIQQTVFDFAQRLTKVSHDQVNSGIVNYEQAIINQGSNYQFSKALLIIT